MYILAGICQHRIWLGRHPNFQACLMDDADDVDSFRIGDSSWRDPEMGRDVLQRVHRCLQLFDEPDTGIDLLLRVDVGGRFACLDANPNRVFVDAR